MTNNKDKESKVCIIIAYFGKLPNYFELWLKSCEWNPTVDFLVCSDIPMDHSPQNVHWLNMRFEEFKKMTEQKLQMQVRLDTPYECCDFKAVYGVIFEDYLKGYDYWGYCDMDMVFGDLDWFFKKYNLEMYDRFQAYGHLSLMRNTKENNERYRLPCRKGRGYKDSFITEGSTHFCEDEINEIFYAYGFPFFDKRIHADISPEYHRMTLSFKESHLKNYKHQTFYWQNGKVWRAYIHDNKLWRGVEVDEFAYIHFQKRKMKEITFDVKQTTGFYVCQDHFEVKQEIGKPSMSEVKRTNPYSCFIDLADTLRIITYRFKRRLSRGRQIK